LRDGSHRVLERPTINASTVFPAACDPELLAVLGQEVLQRCNQAAAFSEHPSQLTRTFCSRAMVECHRAMRTWMQAAGMHCRVDAAGNLIGRWEPDCRPDSHPTAVLIIGSHLDTVPNGGKYDGILGVLLGVALVEALSRRKQSCPFAIEIVGFSEEEGVRFATPYIG
jgi:allantoate deiminase